MDDTFEIIVTFAQVYPRPPADSDGARGILQHAFEIERLHFAAVQEKCRAFVGVMLNGNLEGQE